MNNEINVFLRLLNGRRFAAELGGSARDVRAFTAEVEAAGAEASVFAAGGAAMSASLFAVGHASRVAMFALTGAAGAAIDLGFKFDATMQSNTLAFEKFTGSAQTARTELNQLFEVAAATPFTFADITTAARRLQAFGFSAQDTTKWIKVLGDTISYTGGSADDVLRAVKTVGEIHSLGRLQYRQILQLTTLGIGAQDILQKKLHITGKQWHNISKANISDTQALGALQEGLIEKYGGGAAKYSKTFVGQINKVRDYTQRAAGQLVQPLFTELQKVVFPDVNRWLSGPGFKRAIPTIRTVFEGLGTVIAAPFVIGARAGKMLWDALKPAKPFWENVLKPFVEGVGKGIGVMVVTSFKVLVGVLKEFTTLLGTVSKALGGTGDGFKVLGEVIGFFYAKRILVAMSGLSKFPAIFRLIGATARIAAVPVNLFMGSLARLPGAARLGALGSAMGGRLAMGVGVALRAFGWAALGAYIAHELGLDHIILDPIANALRSPLHDFVNFVAPGTYATHTGNDSKYQGGFYTDPGQGHFSSGNWVQDKHPYLKRHPIGGKAGGGYMDSSGWSWVGEKGPELLWLPGGSHVINSAAAKASLRHQGQTGHGWGGNIEPPTFKDVNIHLTAPIIIDKRQVGEAVGSYTAERAARS